MDQDVKDLYVLPGPKNKRRERRHALNSSIILTSYKSLCGCWSECWNRRVAHRKCMNGPYFIKDRKIKGLTMGHSNTFSVDCRPNREAVNTFVFLAGSPFLIFFSLRNQLATVKYVRDSQLSPKKRKKKRLDHTNCATGQTFSTLSAHIFVYDPDERRKAFRVPRAAFS